MEGFLSGIMECAQSGCTNFTFATSTFRADQGDPVLVQLSFDGFCYSQLGVVQGVSGGFLNVVVDLQNLWRQRLCCRVKEGQKLVANPIRHGDAESVEVAGDAIHLGKTVVGVGCGAGNRNGAAVKAFFQDGHNIPVFRL